MSVAYSYKGRDMTGRLLTGRVEAAGRCEALFLLENKSFTVIELFHANRFLDKLTGLFEKRFTSKELSVFCKQLAVMISAGIPFIESLRVIRQQAACQRMQKVLMKVIAAIEEGKSLSEAFEEQKNFFPDLFLSALAAGEASAALSDTLEHLAAGFEREEHLTAKIRSAVTYPLLIAGVALIALVALMVFVVPIFVDVFSQMKAVLPLPTRFLIGLSNIFRDYWLLFIFLTIVLGIVLQFSCSKAKGRNVRDEVLLYLPVWGSILKRTLTARFARFLEMLLRSGMPLLNSLELLEKSVNHSVFKREMRMLKTALQEGGRLAPALLHSSFFPRLAVQMLTVGEEAGSLEVLLERIASFYEREAEEAVSRFSSLIEPFLIIFVGLFVGFLALSIYFPLFDMAGALQSGGALL